MLRFIVDYGEKTERFFANDLQNIYYHFLFKRLMKSRIKSKDFVIDSKFQKDSIKYWKRFNSISTIWHDFYYANNGIKDVRYIPENLYYSKIEPFYNRKSFAAAIDDKNYYSELFKGYNHTKAIVRNISGLLFDNNFQLISLNQAIEICLRKEKIVLKPSIDGSGGNRVYLVESEKTSAEDIKAIFKRLEQDFVVELVLKQHPDLAIFNQSSVNTIRFISLLNQSGVHVLSSVLRMGGTDSFTDNFSTGGIACGINDETGKTKDIAYNQNYCKFEEHPNGFDFRNRTIVGYSEAKSLIKELHLRFAHFRIISWDIIINEYGEPVILEFNFTPQSIDFHQISNGPLFGDLTDDVLNEVLLSKK